MPCVWPDGSLSSSGRLMLAAVGPDSTAEDVAGTTGIPLFRVRSSLRELLAAGFINEQGGHFKQTAQGIEKVKSDD